MRSLLLKPATLLTLLRPLLNIVERRHSLDELLKISMYLSKWYREVRNKAFQWQQSKGIATQSCATLEESNQDQKTEIGFVCPFECIKTRSWIFAKTIPKGLLQCYDDGTRFGGREFKNENKRLCWRKCYKNTQLVGLIVTKCLYPPTSDLFTVALHR